MKIPQANCFQMDKLTLLLATILEWKIFISAYIRDCMFSMTVFYDLLDRGGNV